MACNPYLNDVKQTNGCRIWENPDAIRKYQVPNKPIEIFIKNLPKDHFEVDILPHFERFGPICQFRLLIDYDDGNRGFAYLIYFFEKSALECLDTMGYFIIKPGLILDVEKSQERSHLLALNVPSALPDSEIEKGFKSLYVDISKVVTRRSSSDGSSTNHGNCTSILEFPNHKSALNAKRWSGVGSVNVWNRNIKILWARKDQIEDLLKQSQDVKHVLFHNVPEYLDPLDFGNMLCESVGSHEIVTIRPMKNDWLVEFISTEAAYVVFTTFNGRIIENQKIITEWVTRDRLKLMLSFADFDFELRNMCIANYWDPPIFIYGRIIAFTQTQLVSVIIKNNRKNQFITILIETCYEKLTEIHARVCEIVFLFLEQLMDLPKKNVVIKTSNSFAFIVGSIADLSDPKLVISHMITHESKMLYLNEIYALSKMSHQLIASDITDDIYAEYKIILKEKNIDHQFICGVVSDGYWLGCIDPIYRRGKPLKYRMDSRNMILAMCDFESFSNTSMKRFPTQQDISAQGLQSGGQLKIDKIEMIPIEVIQRRDVHFVFRPFIEFNHVDTFGPLQFLIKSLLVEARHDFPFGFERNLTMHTEPQMNQGSSSFMPLQNSLPQAAPIQQRQPKTKNIYCLSNLLMSLAEQNNLH